MLRLFFSSELIKSTSFKCLHSVPTIGILIPNDVEKLSQFRSDGLLILVVEKDSTFQKLIDDKIERFIGNCILITVSDSLKCVSSAIVFGSGCFLIKSFDFSMILLLIDGLPYRAHKGKGYPDVNTRRFLRRLWDELQLPPLALVDADPHGISIHCVYRFGSQVGVKKKSHHPKCCCLIMDLFSCRVVTLTCVCVSIYLSYRIWRTSNT